MAAAEMVLGKKRVKEKWKMGKGKWGDQFRNKKKVDKRLPSTFDSQIFFPFTVLLIFFPFPDGNTGSGKSNFMLSCFRGHWFCFGAVVDVDEPVWPDWIVHIRARNILRAPQQDIPLLLRRCEAALCM